MSAIKRFLLGVFAFISASVVTVFVITMLIFGGFIVTMLSTLGGVFIIVALVAYGIYEALSGN